MVPEEELAVQVTNVDGVHVDDMDVLEPRQRQIREDLAAQTTSANDQNLCPISKQILHLSRSPQYEENALGNVV